jgi:hypothetical protein
VIKLAVLDETLADVQNRKDIRSNNEETKRQRQTKFAHALLVLLCFFVTFFFSAKKSPSYELFL